MNITIVKNDVLRYGNEIKECAEELDNEIKHINEVIDKINIVWDGNDSLKYINVMREEYVTTMNELKDIINVYGEYLTKIPGAYTVLDNSFASKKI